VRVRLEMDGSRWVDRAVLMQVYFSRQMNRIIWIEEYGLKRIRYIEMDHSADRSSLADQGAYCTCIALHVVD
jgi:hypothetical protein